MEPLDDFKNTIVEYDAATKIVQEREIELERAIIARSDIVKRMSVMLAPKKKFIRNGKVHTLVQRGLTFFLRSGASDENLVEV